MHEHDADAPARAADGEPALGVADRRPGPGRQVVPVVPRKRRAHRGPHERSSSRFTGMTRPMAWTDDRDAPDRPAVQVEQAPLDHLLGPECDVGDRPVGVGVELDPAGAIARRRSRRRRHDDAGPTWCAGRRAGTGPSRRSAPGRSRMGSSSHTRLPRPGCLIAA